MKVPGKIWFRPFWALFGPNLPLFWPKINILGYIFGLLNFADFLSLGFSRLGLWIHACAFVRACVCVSHHIWRSACQILMIFCTKLHLDESKKMFQADF